MKLSKIVLLIGLVFPTLSLADSDALRGSVEFFASNNTQVIDLAQAFERLTGQEQENLQTDSIHLLQKKHIQQSQFEALLGTYTLADQKITADNSEKIISSAYQTLSAKKVFKLAKELTHELKQESVAVFIPNPEQSPGDIILVLKSAYTIDEINQLIHSQLPSQYSQAYSLHLNLQGCSNFHNTRVAEVEWLGSQIKVEEIRTIFPQDEIKAYNGEAYLVFNTGEKQRL